MIALTHSTNEGQEVCALHVPYRKDTYGLSRLITVSRNRCSTAVPCACHVVPELLINRWCLRRNLGSGMVLRSSKVGLLAARVSRRIKHRRRSKGPCPSDAEVILRTWYWTISLKDRYKQAHCVHRRAIWPIQHLQELCT